MKSTIAKKTEGYGYKYTELADINKYCENNDIRYFQEVKTCDINQKDYIYTTIIKDGKEKEYRGCQIVQATLQGIKNPVQEYGSSLTYCRRYSLLMALGLATEDNDAADLTEKKEPTQEDAKNWKFTFGKYKGETMEFILDDDEQYVSWYMNNKATDYDKKCYELLTGEVLPTESQLSDRLQLLVKFNKLIVETSTNREDVYKNYKKEKVDELTDEELKNAIEIMERKL